MSKIIVSGLVNIETSMDIDAFPIEYSPIEYKFFGVNHMVSGVGFNVAKALKKLGDEVELYSIFGNDDFGNAILSELKKEKIPFKFIMKNENFQTPESIVLNDKNGVRKIYCDLKNVQETAYFDEKVSFNDVSLCVVTNINFNRNLINKIKEHNVLIASDVHVLSDLDDEYNQDFLKSADILFLSNEGVMGYEGDFIKSLYEKYHNNIIVIGCGEEGALAYKGDENRYFYEPANAPKGVKNTVGAGDALFSAFIHFYLKKKDIEYALKMATLFAGLKISEPGGSNGFVDEEELSTYL